MDAPSAPLADRSEAKGILLLASGSWILLSTPHLDTPETPCTASENLRISPSQCNRA